MLLDTQDLGIDTYIQGLCVGGIIHIAQQMSEAKTDR